MYINPQKSRDALTVIEQWTRGEASSEDCKKARYAADANAAAYAKCADIVRQHYPNAPRLP